MKNYVFIGHSIANVKAIEGIRAKDQESNITIISDDAFHPYGQDRAWAFLGREIKERQVFEHPESFYKQHRIHFVTGQAITRFNFKRCQIFLENKEHVSYDVLVLADIATPRLPDIKGHHKTGVYQALRLADIRTIAEQAVFADTIIVQVSSVIGFLTACALSRHVQNVLICASSNILPGILDAQSSDVLRQLMDGTGVRLMLDNPMEEILGDSDVKAVRFRSGKVMAAEMVILDDVRLDMRPFQETGLAYPAAEGPRSKFKTNFPNVYWVDAVLKSFTPEAGSPYAALRGELESQGRALASELLGEAMAEVNLSSWSRFQMKGLSGFWIGDTRSSEGMQEFSSFDAQKNVFKKIFTRQGVWTGAVFFNADGQFDQVFQLVEEKVNIQGIEEKILEESFDLQSLKSAIING